MLDFSIVTGSQGRQRRDAMKRLGRREWALVAVAALLLAVALKPVTGHAEPPLDLPRANSGRFALVTYNIAGLPEGISPSRPSLNIPRIAPLLNDYDIVLIQEDFAFQLELRRGLQHPFRSPDFKRRRGLDFGDGLSRFASAPFTDHMRAAWQECHGYLEAGCDCLTSKGFTMARHHFAQSATVDVYNLHMDAGGRGGDRAARARQLEQLLQAIETQSAERAVIVAGDTNMRRPELAVLASWTTRAGLADVCQALRCSDPGRIDRVFFRPSKEVKLRARSWRIDDRFVDDRGRPLSDHLAIAVDFEWQLEQKSVAASR